MYLTIPSVVILSPIIFLSSRAKLKGNKRYSDGLMPIQWVEMQPTKPNKSGCSITVFIAERPPILAPIIPMLCLPSLVLNLSSRKGRSFFIIKSG